MEIKVIGSGSSGNCYLIDDGRTALLLDAGVPFSAVQQAMDFDTGAIRGCLITHRHGDHAKAGKQLAKRGIKVYGNTNTAVDIGKGACVLQPRIAYGIDTFTILPFEVEHDVPCFGYRIDSLVTGERLVYITDAAGFRFSIKGATHLLVECNHSHKKIMERVRAGEMNAMLGYRVLNTHMSIEKFSGYLVDGHIDVERLSEVMLIHLSDGNSDAEDFRQRVQELVPEANVTVW